MRFKDIVNRGIVNLTNCENEPIHIPGSIQPHGFLLGVSQKGFVVEFCSENCYDFIGATHQQLLGKNIQQVFGAEEGGKLSAYLTTAGNTVAPLTLTINKAGFNCNSHLSNNIWVLEFEPVAANNLAISDVYLQTKQFTDYMQNATTLQSLCQAVATETKAITGYDRVMIYKFDEEANGEVVAESVNDNLEPFLGLHYPHTDIPAQARQLYIKNLLRLIADVNYKPVPIYTIDDGTDKNLDLSLSTLRSVSPIHIEYLHNMGVGATLTISLMYQGKLWGLIACHHYSPKYINMDTRIAAQLQGHFLTSQIPVRQDAEEYGVARKVNSSLDVLLASVFSSETLMLANLVQLPELLKVTNATGVIILVDDELFCQGKVPDEGFIRNLADWLHSYSPPIGFSTQKLVSAYPEAETCTYAAGIIYHSLGSGANNCIIWCRAEALQEVNWAGDPTKAIEKNEKGLSPRKSFELWKEVKKCESLPWQKPELVAAANFSNALQKHVHMLFLSKEELKQRLLSEKLKEANDELENINWIGSHDLKEPLRKIQMFASRILEEEERTDRGVVNSVKKMSESALRMQTLIKDILAYSKLSHVEEGFVKVDLNLVFKEVLEELNYEITTKNALVQAGELPAVNGISFLLHQLFINLVSNSLKFSKANVTPVISITALPDERIEDDAVAGVYQRIAFVDNGIGFDNRYSESIFKVFSRLHKTSEYQGTGVGLALCRKIMQTHKGYIIAQGTPGEGTTFTLYFPKEV